MISAGTLRDTDEIMEFIDREWQTNHILSKNKDFFLYEYASKNSLNFVISRNEERINGILGFLKSSSDEHSTVWTTMWKVSKSNGSPILGIRMLKYLQSQGYKSVMSSGINASTEEIYRYLGFHVGELSHYYIPNQTLETYKIAKFNKVKLDISCTLEISENLIFKEVTIQELKHFFRFTKFLKKIPFKDFEYFKKRFFDHPIYNYEVYGVFELDEILSILVVRVVRNETSSCIRIVDFHGQEETLGIHASNLSKKMFSEGHEYIDILTFGLSDHLLKKSGFKRLDQSKIDVVVPNLFEPFVQKNIRLGFFCNIKNLADLRIYKADGDQDRPSLLGDKK
jgi:hypothetical protein